MSIKFLGRAVMVATCIIGLSSCGSNSYLFQKSDLLYVAQDHPVVFARDGEKGVGDSIRTLDRFAGDTIPSFATRETPSKGATHYLIFDRDSVWVMMGKGVTTVYNWSVGQQSTTFKLPKDHDPQAWGRAVKFVNEHSAMKIQTQTELIIQTFNPINYADIGFSVTKIPYGDSVEYSVESSKMGLYGSLSDESWAKRLAYFMSTGIDYKRW